MKVIHMLSGLALAVALGGCANDKGTYVPVPVAAAGAPDVAMQNVIRQPSVTGTAWIRQRVALPPDAVLTVTLSDASVADAPSKVLSQKVARLNGKQAPFSFILPFNPQDIQPNARILLSAAITENGRLLFVTDNVQSVINGGGTKADLNLVPVQNAAIPASTDSGAMTTVPVTSPTQITPSSAIPAPTTY